MKLRAAALFALALLSVVGCVTPLTIAESRDAGEDAPAPGQFGQAGPLDSGFEGDASSLGDLPSLPDASDGGD
jgi:hypothetical protein